MLHFSSSNIPLCTSNISPTTNNNNNNNNTYRRLPSILIDFIAITLCDVLPIKSSLRGKEIPTVRGRPLPELLYFIQKITIGAEINCRTAIVALIYLERIKSFLPNHAVGGYDTSHRLLLGSLLLASKFLKGSTWTNNTLTNHQLYDLCDGLFHYQDIDQLERAFLKLIQYQCWVDDKDVNDFILKHRDDLGL
ncbi:hypothetical protein BJ944DRAFT_159546 [Cunninghamella echinulata]|nr:hypothetical protein BJ944DRAFT_159546 [Cunninghamella echinulata]